MDVLQQGKKPHNPQVTFNFTEYKKKTNLGAIIESNPRTNITLFSTSVYAVCVPFCGLTRDPLKHVRLDC